MLVNVPKNSVSSWVTLRSCIRVDLQVVHEIRYRYGVRSAEYRKGVTVCIRIKHDREPSTSVVGIQIQAETEACDPFFSKDQFQFFLCRTSIIEGHNGGDVCIFIRNY